MVDITAQLHQIARQYMIRLFEEDFNDPVALGRCAALAGLSPETFHSRFQYAGSNVMGAKGLGAIARFLLGSVSTRVVQHANCSVLVAR